ncbi:50S ribosomal protein L21, partial [Mesorhizobium sp. M00.F.Ca.ET.149.01.1.1]
RKIGHRQLLTTVRIAEILLGGAKPSKKAAAKPEAKAEAKTEVAAEAKAEVAAKEPKAKKEAKADAAAGEEAKAAPLFKAPKGEPDDLTVIKGIGPVAAKDLAEQGIVTFAQLAKLSDKD